jgi:hypothetical protein
MAIFRIQSLINCFTGCLPLLYLVLLNAFLTVVAEGVGNETCCFLLFMVCQGNVNWFSDGSELDPPVDNGRKTILIHEREVFDAMYRYFESSDTPIRGGEFIETLNYMEKNIFYLKDGNRVQIKIHGNHNNPMHQFDRSGQYLPIRRIQCLVFTDEHNERAVDPLLLSTPDLHNNWWIAQWSSGLKQYGEHEYRHLPPPEHWRASNGMEALHQMLQHFDPQMLQNFDPQMLQNFDPNGILHQFYANNPFGFN